MAFAWVNGHVLHYRLRGPEGAPVVVLANSLGTDLRIWDGFVDLLDQRYRFLCFDKSGHGLSEGGPAAATIAGHGDDVIALLSHLRIDRFAMVGLSVGGQIAMDVALRLAGRVTALVLCDTAAKLGAPEAWDARIAAVEAGGMEAIADAVMERWLSEPYRTMRPVDTAGWTQMLLRTPIAGYADVCRALRDADYREAVGALAVPTLAIAGSVDLSTPPDVVRATAALIAGARFELIGGIGHLPPLEVPGRLAALVDDFLKDHGHG